MLIPLCPNVLLRNQLFWLKKDSPYYFVICATEKELFDLYRTILIKDCKDCVKGHVLILPHFNSLF